MKSQSLTIVLHSLGLKIIVDLLLFDRIKVSESKWYLLSSKSSKANMTNALETLKERETGSGLEYLAGWALCGTSCWVPCFLSIQLALQCIPQQRRPDPGSLCWVYLSCVVCGTQESNMATPAHGRPWDALFKLCCGIFAFWACLLGVCLTFVMCLCIYVHRGCERIGLRWLWKERDKNKDNTPKMTIASQIHYCSKDELF